MTFSRAATFATLAWLVSQCNAQSYGSKSSLPVVDLGYELQQATEYNSTGKIYSFNNIRYAAPPTGENRFRAPKSPAQNRGVVQNGTQDRICPQAGTGWTEIAAQFIPEFVAGQTVFNASSFNVSTSTAPPPQDPRTTEDCLFLDVVVPRDIFDAGDDCGAPVLVWIYGGGYTEGSKSDSGNPAGLLKRSMSEGSKGVIYVAMNYRLGAFGWLSGPTFQEDGTANAGLYDQRFALEWVQKHISKFGGDPNKVTVFGESAGGGSIMHQITAYGGLKGPVPFQQAVPQSPGFLPLTSNVQQEQIFNDYLDALNVSTLEEARQLPFATLQAANIEQVGTAPYGTFLYGPAVDGDFVPALPGELLLHGQYAKNLNIMVGHNGDEGLLFTSPFIQNNSAFTALLHQNLPTANAATIKYITNTLYPPVFDGSQAQHYTSQVGRAAALTSEFVFTCNTFWLDKAYNNDTHAYYFTVPPATHGEDVAYTYFNGPNPAVLSNQIAIDLQLYITSFAKTGNPNGAGAPNFPVYSDSAIVQELNITGISQVRDPTANYRCDWWQKALYT